MTTITQWTFEGDVITPFTGTGTASLVGGATATFATGNITGRAWNTSTYPAQGTGNRTRGVQFAVPTTGFQNIQVAFDLRHSNTAANTVVFQFSTDGSSFTDSLTFRATAGDTFFSRSVDLSTITGLNNNSNTTFRILSAFDPPDVGTAFVAANPPSTYSTGGTLRFDNVTITGNAISTPTPPPTPTPAPVASNPNFLRQVGVIGSANGAEIPAFDPGSRRLFVVAGNVVEIIDLSNPAIPTLIGTLTISGTPAPGFSFVPNSVAVRNGIVAVAIAEEDGLNNQNLGQVQFFNASNGQFIRSVTVGFLPDAVAFSPDGTRVLTANEGEPNEGFTSDPEGSISIINIANGVINATVQTATFTSFNAQRASLIAQGVRIFGRIDTNADRLPDTDSTVAQDLEPEFIAFSGDGTRAYVTLQENNALAVVNIAAATVEQILPLGVKNHSLPGNGLDASDRDVDGTSGGGGRINIQNWPIFGIYQPDAIASFTVGGQTFYVVANEGDGRVRPTGGAILTGIAEGGVFNDEITLGALIDRGLLDLDNNGVADTNATVAPNGQTLGVLRLAQNLGRLVFTNAAGNTDGDSLIEQLTAFGARSFSIFDGNGSLVFDSGDALERITAAALPLVFNTNNSNNTLDNRSDNKGPEPEGVVTATIDGQVFAFIGLERISGVIVYNVTDPQNPSFVQYFNNRNFSIDPIPTPTAPATNSGPEGLTFISAADSPSGLPLVVVANEVSRTVQILQIGTSIGEVQGTGADSPLVGQTVTIEGIVTGDFQDGDGDSRNLGGFFVQALTPDRNPLTSDGIFVFDDRATGADVTTAPTVGVTPGDRVRVTGVVREQFSETQINVTATGGRVEVISRGNPLPAPVAIDLPATGRVTANDFINQADADGIAELSDFVANLERFEGLRVTFTDPLFVTEHFNLDRFGEVRLIEGDRAFQFTNSNAPSTTAFPLHLQNIAARSVFLDDGNSVSNPNPIVFPDPNGITTANAANIRMDTQVTNLVGNLNFAFGQYRLQPTQAPTFSNTQNPRPALPNVGGTLQVGKLNVRNFFTNLVDRSDNAPPNPLTTAIGATDTTARGASNQAEFARQQQKLFTTLSRLNADVFSLNEIENNGFGPGSAIDTLVRGLNAATGRRYAFVQPPDSELTSTPAGLRLGSDAITNAIIFDTARVAIAPNTRVVTLNDREISRLPGNPFPELGNLDASGIDPDLDDRIFDGINSGRNPLAATFVQLSNGAQFTTVSNHFKSKSASGLTNVNSPNFDQNNGSSFWDDQRNRSSRALLEWLRTSPTGSTDPDVLILGDLNAYPRERPIVTLENGGFDNLVFRFFDRSTSTQAQPYSFVFDGQAGVLDYAFSSRSLTSQVTGARDWHIHSDEPDAIDYELDFGRPASLFDGTVPFRSSDHDPLLVGLNLRTPFVGIFPALPLPPSIRSGNIFVPGIGNIVFIPNPNVTLIDASGNILLQGATQF